MKLFTSRQLRQITVAGLASLLATGANAYTGDPSRFSDLDGTTIPQQINGKFIAGVNVGWTGEQYGTDLGPNHVFPRSGFSGNTPPAGAVPGGPNYAVAGGQAVVGEAAATSDAGNTIVRIFVFEGAQGLNFGSDGRVTGYDQSVLINLKTSLDSLKQNQKAILVLTDPATDFGITSGVPIIRNVENGLNVKYDGTTLDGAIVGGDGNGQQIADFYTNTDARYQFEQNAVKQLASDLHTQGYDGKILAYDVANEYNILIDRQFSDGRFYTGASDSAGSEYVIKSFINDTSDAVHAGGYQGYITASLSGYAATQAGYNTDFVDVHAYPGDEVNDLATFEAKADDFFSNGGGKLPASGTKPYILAESGAKSLSKADQAVAEQRLAEDAIKAGYSGFLPWVIGATTVSGQEPFALTTANQDGSFNELDGFRVLKDLNAYLAQRGVL